jgi:hypothetical protein
LINQRPCVDRNKNREVLSETPFDPLAGNQRLKSTQPGNAAGRLPLALAPR